jgi:hypothetical protein
VCATLTVQTGLRRVWDDGTKAEMPGERAPRQRPSFADRTLGCSQGTEGFSCRSKRVWPPSPSPRGTNRKVNSTLVWKQSFSYVHAFAKEEINCLKKPSKKRGQKSNPGSRTPNPRTLPRTFLDLLDLEADLYRVVLCLYRQQFYDRQACSVVSI